jgi:hypothetical protein
MSSSIWRTFSVNWPCPALKRFSFFLRKQLWVNCSSSVLPDSSTAPPKKRLAATFGLSKSIRVEKGVSFIVLVTGESLLFAAVTVSCLRWDAELGSTSSTSKPLPGWVRGGVEEADACTTCGGDDEQKELS